MATVIYSLCALTAFLCTVLLWRSWRRAGHRLLFWSALCFGVLTLNNVLLVLDKVFLPDEISLITWRLAAGLIAVLLLLFGLVWGEE